jgi:hypothetical protein
VGLILNTTCSLESRAGTNLLYCESELDPVECMGERGRVPIQISRHCIEGGVVSLDSPQVPLCTWLMSWSVVLLCKWKVLL